jgi:hypothetical protein
MDLTLMAFKRLLKSSNRAFVSYLETLLLNPCMPNVSTRYFVTTCTSHQG